MSFGSSISVFGFLVVCCLVPGSSAWWSWGTEVPENCPHVNNVTHVCSTLHISYNNLCIRRELCDDEEEGGDDDHEDKRKRRQAEESEDDDENDDEDDDEVYGATKCRNGVRWTVTRCTLYKCERECCEGYYKDRRGRCIEDSGEFVCQNGGTRIERKNGNYRCICPPDFKGGKCQTPICDCRNMGNCTVKDGRPHCECPDGFSGDYCENAICNLQCQNGGSCLTDGMNTVCKCPEGYVGEVCEDKYVNPETCPESSYHSSSNCSLQCLFNEDCPDGQVCCNEGSNMICRDPKPKACLYEGEEMPLGEPFSPEPCTRCHCYEDGIHRCYTMSCQPPMCDVHITKPGECCPSCAEQCYHNGVTYQHGDSFRDDCNTCSCNDGRVACTEMACPPPETCEYKGTTYADGLTFMDICNTCHCSEGRVSCTEMLCEPQNCTTPDGTVHASGTTFELDECNTCRCDNGYMACTQIPCVTVSPVCNYNGTEYKEDDSFMIDCNTCMCKNGAISCTKVYCENIVEKEDIARDEQCLLFPRCFQKTFRSFQSCCQAYNFPYCKIDCSTCMCKNGAISCTKVYCGCTLDCQNDGKCVKKDEVEMCHCLPPYRGELCQRKHENSEKCPVPDPSTFEPTDNCRTQCEVNANCSTGMLCCMEGCHMICRSPKEAKCNHGGREFNPGESYKPSACEDCRCTDTGFMACMVMDCARPICPDGRDPIQEKDKCCPVCPEPLPPSIKCPKDILELELSPTSDFITLTSKNTLVKAKNWKGEDLRVRFDPPTVEHCNCYDSDRAVQWAVAAVSDKGRIERCRVAFVVKDVTAPVFQSCPEDKYVFDDEPITYKKPIYTDNVGIGGSKCTMAPYNRTYPVGDHRFKYEIWDFDRNYAACSFRLSVSSRDTSYPNLPEGLKERSEGPNVALIVTPIAGLVAIVCMIVAFLLCCRFRRDHNNSTLASRQGDNRPRDAYDNNIYAVPDDVKPPDYKSFPPNPPAYQSDNVSMKSDYTFLPPPEYKEVEEVRMPAAYENPDYASIQSDESSDNKPSVVVKM